MVWLRVVPILFLIVANTLLHALPLISVALFKALLPFKPVRLACNAILTWRGSLPPMARR